MEEQYAQMAQSVWTDMQNQFSMYQISAILMFFAILGIIILFRPMFPFVWSRFVSHDIVVGLLDNKNNIIPTLGFKLINGVWYYKGEPLYFVKNYPGTYFFAGIPFTVLSLELSMLKNPLYMKYSKVLRDWGYKNMDMLEEAILFSQMQPDDLRVKEMMTRYGIKQYDTLKKKINPHGLTIKHKEVKPFFSSIQLSEIMGYGDDIPPEDILGEVDDIYEANKPNNAAMKKLRDILPYCIIIVAATGLIVVLYKVFV